MQKVAPTSRPSATKGAPTSRRFDGKLASNRIAADDSLGRPGAVMLIPQHPR